MLLQGGVWDAPPLVLNGAWEGSNDKRGRRREGRVGKADTGLEWVGGYREWGGRGLVITETGEGRSCRVEGSRERGGEMGEETQRNTTQCKGVVVSFFCPQGRTVLGLRGGFGRM